MLENCDLLIHWFTENRGIVHPKVTPVPIGLANFRQLNETNAELERLEPFLR